MEFKDIAQAFMDFGVTSLLAILVVVLLVVIVSKLPKMIQKYADDWKKDRKAEDDKFDKQMEIITRLATTSNELQRESTEIIKKNSDLISSCMSTNQLMIQKIEILIEQSCRTEKATLVNREIASKAHDLALQVNERTKK